MNFGNELIFDDVSPTTMSLVAAFYWTIRDKSDPFNFPRQCSNILQFGGKYYVGFSWEFLQIFQR